MLDPALAETNVTLLQAVAGALAYLTAVLGFACFGGAHVLRHWRRS
jgi:hypothetical protein